jgi:spermidine synthase
MQNRSVAATPVRRSALLTIFFLSGAAALVYEVLWLKELGLLFGVTAYAAATTLAVFFSACRREA